MRKSQRQGFENQPLPGAARGQVVQGECFAGAIKHRHLRGQREGKPHPVLRIDTHRVRVVSLVHGVGDELLGGDIELQQRLLHGRGDKNIAVLLRVRQRVHAHVVVHLREHFEAVSHDAAEFHVGSVRHLVHCVLAGFRVQLIQAVKQVVADIDIAIGMQEKVVHLREAVADHPLGHFHAGQMRFPAAAAAGWLCGFSRSARYSLRSSCATRW